MYLTSQQKIKCMIGTIFFLLFFGYLRTFVVNIPLDTKSIIINTLLFFIWIGYSYAISNTFVETSNQDPDLLKL